MLDIPSFGPKGDSFVLGVIAGIVLCMLVIGVLVLFTPPLHEVSIDGEIRFCVPVE